MVELSAPLHVEAGVAGAVLRVTIGNSHGKVALPRLAETGIPAAGSLSRLQQPSFGGRPLPELTVRTIGAGWGYVGSSRGDTFISAFRLRAPIGDRGGAIPDQMSMLGRAFDAWYGLVRDWLCAWSGQERDRCLRDEQCSIHAVLRDDGRHQLFGSGVTAGTIIVMGERATTLEELRAAFQCASASYLLPLDHGLLLQAKAEALIGSSRRAVVDACCAAEVAISKALRKRLDQAGVPEGTILSVLSHTSGIVELVRLLMVSGAKMSVSEARVMDRLAGPRNEAVHGGKALTAKQADNAITVARAIITDVHPLPSPREASRAARLTLAQP